MSKIKCVDDTNFDKEVLESELPVLVDIGASWCGPCQKQLPIVEKFASENIEKIKVVTMDIDECPQTSARYGIRGVPSLLFFDEGEKVQHQVGLTNLSTLNDLAANKFKK